MFFLLGILLVAGAAAGGYLVLISGASSDIAVAVLDRTINLSPIELFFAGATSAMAFILGVAFIAVGARQINVRHRELRRVRERAAQAARLERERDRLERRLSSDHVSAKDRLVARAGKK